MLKDYDSAADLGYQCSLTFVSAVLSSLLTSFSPCFSLPSVPLLQLSTHNGHREAELNTQSPNPQQNRSRRNVSSNLPPTPVTCKKLTLTSTQQSPDDVVITLAIRTPLTKGFKGGFKDTPLDYIVYSLLKEVIAKSNIDPQLVEDICLGNVCSIFSASRAQSHIALD